MIFVKLHGFSFTDPPRPRGAHDGVGGAGDVVAIAVFTTWGRGVDVSANFERIVLSCIEADFYE